MAKRMFLLALLLVVVLVSFVGCRGYGYRSTFGGGPHLDYLPELPLPFFMRHKPVPYEELKYVYPPEDNISGL